MNEIVELFQLAPNLGLISCKRGWTEKGHSAPGIFKYGVTSLNKKGTMVHPIPTVAPSCRTALPADVKSAREVSEVPLLWVGAFAFKWTLLCWPLSFKKHC